MLSVSLDRSVQIRIVPVAESSPCQALPLKLPSSLSTPVHLDTLNWLVLDGEYEIPPAQLLGARHWEYPIDFTLRLASLVHLHIEEHIDSRYAITADIRQQTDDSHSVQVEFESKEFTTSLPPGQYQLRILVQHVSGVSHKLCPVRFVLIEYRSELPLTLSCGYQSFLFKLHLYPTPATPPESCTASMPPESILYVCLLLLALCCNADMESDCTAMPNECHTSRLATTPTFARLMLHSLRAHFRSRHRCSLA